MTERTTDLQKELHSLQYDLLLRQRIDCSKEENQKYRELLKNGGSLPEGVFAYKNDLGENIYQYYTVHIPENLSKEERLEYIILKQYELIKTIKNCVLFFAILAAISFLLSFLTLL